MQEAGDPCKSREPAKLTAFLHPHVAVLCRWGCIAFSLPAVLLIVRTADASALWLAGYLWHILLSADAPGAAAWQQSAESIKGVLNESEHHSCTSGCSLWCLCCSSHMLIDAHTNDSQHR